MVEESLKQLGFTENEATVYQSVVKFGKALPATIARDTKINRSTVYGVISSLMEKGVVTEDLGGKTAYVVAKPLESLEEIPRKTRKELKAKEKAVTNVMEELSQLAGSATYSPPKIRFVGERDMNDYMMKRIKVWQKSGFEYDNTWWGFQDYSLIEQYEKWIDYSWKAAPKGWQLKMISNQSPVETKTALKYKNRHMKYWDKKTDFTTTVAISGDYVIMQMTREKPHYMIEIYDKTLAHNLREYFKNVWNELFE